MNPPSLQPEYEPTVLKTNIKDENIEYWEFVEEDDQFENTNDLENSESYNNDSPRHEPISVEEPLNSSH